MSKSLNAPLISPFIKVSLLSGRSSDRRSQSAGLVQKQPDVVGDLIRVQRGCVHHAHDAFGVQQVDRIGVYDEVPVRKVPLE